MLLYFLLFIIAFFAAGFSESYAALQTGALFSALAALFILGAKEKKAITVLLSAALAGSLLGMAVMVMSPGNQLRLNTLQQAADAWTIARLSTRFGGQFLLDSIKGFWLPYAISFLIGILSGALFMSNYSFSLTTSKKAILTFLIPTIIYFLVVCICAPTAFGMMAYPENRVLMLARYVMTSGFILYGFFLGLILMESFNKTQKLKEIFMVGLLILSLYPFRSVIVLWKDFRVSKERALLWDQRNSVILGQIANGEDQITVRAFDSFDQIAEIGSDPSFWVNQCAAQFYGVESITAIEIEHE